jgi:hypothetical protein
MPVVAGVKEKLHFPLYDAFVVRDANDTFQAAMRRGGDERMIRFFVDVQNKTKLETNMQAAGALPSLNSYEARAMRVVVSRVEEPQLSPPGQGTVRTAEFLDALIYNSVTTLLAGEKIMIEMPTYWFPAGAGTSTADPLQATASHGNPDPMATFRFAEPVTITPNQAFRVELLFPSGPPPPVVLNAHGPFRLWVVLDGYLTRDVQ